MKKWLNLIIFLLPLYLVEIRIGFVPFNVLELLIWLAFGLWLIQGKYSAITISKYRSFVFPALLILIATTLATLFSSDLVVSAGILKSWFLAPVIFGLMAIGEIKEEKDGIKILAWLAYSSGSVALVALFYFFAGHLTFDGRLSAFYLSPNHLAMYLAPGFLISQFFLFRAVQKKSRLFWTMANLIIGTALYFTYSYAAWLSVLVAGLFLAFFVFRSNLTKKLFILYSLLFILLLAVLFFSQLDTDKMNNLLNSTRSSWQSRLMIWHAAGEILKDHPILGIGPGLFQMFYLKYQNLFVMPYLEWAVPQPHNLFLAFWLETGILGLAAFFWLLHGFFKKVILKIKQQNQLALVLFCLMGYTVLHGLVDTTYFKNDLAMIFWLVIALAAVTSVKIGEM